MLRETGVFTQDEISVAGEVIDVALAHEQTNDYIIYTGVEAGTNSIAGYYCVGPTPLTSGTFDLYWIAVGHSLHNKGVGRRLLLHAEALVASLGGRLLIAETSSKPSYDNTRRFYVRNDYLEVARIKDYYCIGDDLVVYGKYLSQ